MNPLAALAILDLGFSPLFLVFVVVTFGTWIVALVDVLKERVSW